MNEYILKAEATSIPVLPKGQRVEFRNNDEAFEAGWKTCQECIATCIEPADVISRDEAIREMEKIISPCGEAGNGDAISREVVLAKLRNLKEPEQGVDGVYIKGMQVPKTCCTCPLIVYVPDIKWNENGKEYIGAYCCKITGELIDNTKREEHCPIRVPDTQNYTLPDEITPPFGSYGDSVNTDEVLKQSKTLKDVSSLPTANPTYGDNCWARLPCGICRNAMMHCPLSVMQPAWTCSSSTTTNQTGGDA